MKRTERGRRGRGEGAGGEKERGGTGKERKEAGRRGRWGGEGEMVGEKRDEGIGVSKRGRREKWNREKGRAERQREW